MAARLARTLRKEGKGEIWHVRGAYPTQIPRRDATGDDAAARRGQVLRGAGATTLASAPAADVAFREGTLFSSQPEVKFDSRRARGYGLYL